MHGKPIPIFPADIGLPVRERDTHKSNYGKLLILGGSVGYTGSVCLCARAAIRSGAGLVSVGVPKEIYPIVAAKLDEPMPFPLERPLNYEDVASKLDGSTVCIIGPGMGRSADTQQFVLDVLKHTIIPTVVDADALFAVKDELHLLRGKIITPHAGEFARLGGVLTGNQAADALRFSEKYGCITVLKGSETAIAFPDGKVYVSRGGNPGMAVGGSGDVLAGIIGGLLGQLPVERGVIAGVCIHGAAGDLCADRLGEYSMTPSDMIEALPYVMKPMIGR